MLLSRSFLLGGMQLFTSAMFLAFIGATLGVKGVHLRDIKKSITVLISYGAIRVPGEFALFGLLAIPTFLVSRFYGVETAGTFSFGLSLLRMGGVMFATFGILLLPHIGRLYAQKNIKRIKIIVEVLLSLSVLVASISIIVFEFFLPYVVSFLMTDSFAYSISSLRWLLIGIIPYVIYLIVRNPLDALSVYPYNSINLSISLAVIVLFLLITKDILFPEISILVGFGLLGGLSVLSWRRVITKKMAGYAKI